MNIIKYKPKIKIWFWSPTWDNSYVIADEEDRPAIELALQNDKFVKIENETWATSRFIKIESLRKINSIQQFIYSQDSDVRAVLQNKEKELLGKFGYWWKSIKLAKNFLERKNISYKDF